MRRAKADTASEVVELEPGPTDVSSRNTRLVLDDAETPTARPGGADEAATNPLDRVIAYKLRRAQLVTFQHFIDFFSGVKLRPAEYALLVVLAQHPGLSQTSAASMLGIKRANFVSLLDALERRGLAERRRVHGDRRSRAIHLSERGRHFAAEAAQIAEGYEAFLIERLGGSRERDQFLSMLDRLIGKG